MLRATSARPERRATLSISLYHPALAIAGCRAHQRLPPRLHASRSTAWLEQQKIEAHSGSAQSSQFQFALLQFSGRSCSPLMCASSQACARARCVEGPRHVAQARTRAKWNTAVQQKEKCVLRPHIKCVTCVQCGHIVQCGHTSAMARTALRPGRAHHASRCSLRQLPEGMPCMMPA